MNFKSFFRQFLDQKPQIDAPTESRAGRIEATFKGREIHEIKRADILAYIQKRRADGAKSATINSEMSIIKGFFRYMMLLEVIIKNPTDMIPIEKNVTQRDRWLTVEEERSLLLASPEWLKDVITFATSTGMRRGEILKLTWKDVDLQEGVIYVRDTKTKTPRTSPITSRVSSVLDKLLEEHLADGYVFQRKGKIIPVQTLEGAFVLAIQKAGIVDLHFHDLRHTFATRLVQHGVDLYTLQRLLGHKNFQMTTRYAHHSVASLRQAVESVPLVSLELPPAEIQPRSVVLPVEPPSVVG